MKKIISILMTIAVLCGCYYCKPVEAAELNELDYSYGTPMELYEDLDGDGIDEYIKMSEEEIALKHTIFYLSVNDKPYECDMGAHWVRGIFITDLNENDNTKEILIIYGYHYYSWFTVLRWENDELIELDVEIPEGMKQDYDTDKRFFPQITVFGDGTLCLEGESGHGEEYIFNKFEEIERGKLVPFAEKSTEEVSITVTLNDIDDGNNHEIQFDQPPIIKDDRTLVPMRAIFEAMGCEVIWDGDLQQVDVYKDGDNVMTLWIDEYEMWTKNGYTTLDVPPQIIGERTLVPVRAISEALDCDVDWDSDTKTVIITTDNSNSYNNYNKYNNLGYVDVSGRTVAQIADEQGMSLDEFLESFGLPADMPGNTTESAAYNCIPLSTMVTMYGMTFDKIKELLSFPDYITEDTTWGDAIGEVTLGNYVGEDNLDEFKKTYGLGDDVTVDTLWKEVRQIVDETSRQERIESENAEK